MIEPPPAVVHDGRYAEARARAYGVARLRGPQKAPSKSQVTLRLAAVVLSHFQSEGPGWQSRINAALRRSIGKAS